MENLEYRQVWVGDRNLKLLEQKFQDYHKDYITNCRILSQTVCGLGWPSEKPGALVVVGEELAAHPYRPGLHVLLAEERQDITELLRLHLEAKHNLKFEETFTDRSNGPAMRFLAQFNHFEQGKSGKQISVRNAPFFDEDGSIFSQLATVKLLIATGDKRLHFSDHPRIAAALGEVEAEKLHALKSGDAQLLAALGYAVAYLQGYPFQVELPKKKPGGGTWGPLSDSYSPLSETDRLMRWNPFEKM